MNAIGRMILKLNRRRLARRRWRQERRVILELNRSLALIADPDELMASITARIREIFATDRIIILRDAADDGVLTPVFSSVWEIEDLKDIRLTQHDRLAKWLVTNETSLVLSQNADVFNYLTAAERQMLTRLGVQVCMPLLALNRLTGLLLLCPLEKQWDLSQDDLGLMQMLMSQASIAFENAYLYQQQRERLRRLYSAERLAAAGQLAASVAHEIRNPLTSIRSTVQYLLEDFDEASPKRELMEGVIAEVDRIDRTVDGLLSLSRGTTSEFESVALRAVVQQAILLVRTQAQNQSVDVAWSPPDTELYVSGDSSQLKQVILNIMINALQAMPNSGRLAIELRSVSGESKGKSKVYLSFSDNGCGISASDIEKVFNPFFTTKQGGTGLGLSICYAIAREHDGDLEIQSQIGAGTTVTLKLPLIE